MKMNNLTSGLSQKQYAAIGKVACEWAYLEGVLRVLFNTITKAGGDLTQKLTSDLRATELFDLLLTVSHKTGQSDQDQPPVYQHLRASKERFDELRRKRNELVHGDWNYQGRGQVAAPHFTARKQKLVGRLLKWSTAQMEATAYDIKGFHDAIVTRREHALAVDGE